MLFHYFATYENKPPSEPCYCHSQVALRYSVYYHVELDRTRIMSQRERHIFVLVAVHTCIHPELASNWLCRHERGDEKDRHELV